MGGAAALATVAIGTSILGSASSALGASEAGSAAQNRSNLQAVILKNNAAVSRKAALDAITRGQVRAQRAATVTGQFIGSQRARLAASGVLVDEGSAQDLVLDTAFVGQQAVRDIRENAEREFLQFQLEALNFENQAIFGGGGGGGGSALASTILSGAGDIAGIGLAFVGSSAGP